MRRRVCILGGGCVALAALALPTHAVESSASWTDVSLAKAQQLDVRSAQTGNRYRIFVSVPATPPPKAGYPVLYVLDGNAMFPVASFLARSAAGRQEVTGHVPPVVVGIGYPNELDFDVPARRRDYTVGAGQPDASANEGGADLFLDFIEQEVKPLIAARYPLDLTRQALFGHSFGGLFVLHALFTRPTSFSTYLASSPSIWWQNKQVLTELPGLLQQKLSPLPRVQISVGALEDEKPKGNYPPGAPPQRPMVSEARALAARLQTTPAWRGQVVYHELQGENHGGVWLPAMTRGMTYFLEQP